MKKVSLIIAYWVAAIVLTALLLVSLNYDWVQAAAMSLTFLPSAMALSFFLPKVDRSKSRKGRILDSIYIILGVMTIAFLLIFSFQTVFIFLKGYDDTTEWSIPSMLLNPIFVAGILAVLAYGNYLLVKRLEERFPSTKPITFTSDYRKVSLKKEDISFIVLARYMQIISDEMIAEYPHHIINIHHSFLPAFIGAKPYHQAYERGVKIIGATSHYVTADLDAGPIIEQDVTRITHKDTPESLVLKGKDLEKIVLSHAVSKHIQRKILTYKNKTIIFS